MSSDKHSHVSRADSQPFIASDCSHFQFSQNWFGENFALGLCTMKTDPWEKWKAEEPEAGEMHILVTVIGKNIPGNDTIINNQTFYPIFVLWPSFLFIIKSIECHYLHTQGTAYKSRGQIHVSGIRTFPELLNWNILHLLPFFSRSELVFAELMESEPDTRYLPGLPGRGSRGQIFLSACFLTSCCGYKATLSTQTFTSDNQRRFCHPGLFRVSISDLTELLTGFEKHPC